MKQRTIYEYHRVEINMSLISSNTSVVITPLQSCIQMKTCSECIKASKNVDMNCQWCSVLQHCSDGLGRKRQEWLHYGCNKEFLSSEDQCKSYGLWRYSASRLVGFNLVCTAIVAAVVIVVMSFFLAWFVYAYRNPSSRSGIWLIEHHPSILMTRAQNSFARLRHSFNANKYRFAMQPEVESLAQM